MLLGLRKSTRAGGAEHASPRQVRPALIALVALGLLSGATVATAGPRSTTALYLSGSSQVATLPDYGPRGSVVVRYQHDRVVTLRFTIANGGVLPVTVSDVQPFPTVLGLLTAETLTVGGKPLPVRLGPGDKAEVVVQGRFDHCEYFTEKAIDPYNGAVVTWGIGPLSRTTTVAYSDTLLVRSPTILDCTDRVMDRSAKQRSEDATITGRG